MLRDFTLKLRDKGKKITPKQYLENSLKQEGGFDDAAMRQDQIRAMIKVGGWVAAVAAVATVAVHKNCNCDRRPHYIGSTLAPIALTIDSAKLVAGFLPEARLRDAGSTYARRERSPVAHGAGPWMLCVLCPERFLAPSLHVNPHPPSAAYTQPYETLRSDFRSGVEGLRERFFQHMELKTMYGKNLAGKNLATLTRVYVDSMNEGNTPTIATAWTRVVEAQCDEGVEKAIAE